MGYDDLYISGAISSVATEALEKIAMVNSMLRTTTCLHIENEAYIGFKDTLEDAEEKLRKAIHLLDLVHKRESGELDKIIQNLKIKSDNTQQTKDNDDIG